MSKLVLVEDDDDDIYFFKSACQNASQPLELIVLRDGVEFVEYVKHHSVHNTLFLLDLNMPKLSGFEALESINEHEKFKQMLIITYTTSSSDRDINKAYELGAKSYLLKPNSVSDIQHLIKQVTQYWFELNNCPEEVS